MDIGTGIAIAGIWIGMGFIASSDTTTNAGFLLGLITASIFSSILIFG